MLLPDRPDQPELMFLCPLTGTTDDVVPVHRQLMKLIGGALPARAYSAIPHIESRARRIATRKEGRSRSTVSQRMGTLTPKYS